MRACPPQRGDVVVAILCQSGEGWQWPAGFVLAVFASTGGQFEKTSFQTVQKEPVLLNIYASVFSFFVLDFFFFFFFSRQCFVGEPEPCRRRPISLELEDQD